MEKIKKNLKALVHGFFYGLKDADDVISTKASYGSSDSEIVQTQVKDNVYNDLLQGHETQRVKELRDEFYRTIDKASKLKVNISVGGNFEEDFDNPDMEMTATSVKKTALDFVCKIDVFNPENLHLKCIQDNMLVPEKNAFSVGGLLDDKHVSIFKIQRDGFIPRFKIEDYATKVVIRVIDNNTSYLDFYVSTYASQFGFVYKPDGKVKKDNSALLISELKRLLEKQIRTSDVVEISEFSFDSEKAYGVANPCHFEFDNIEYVSTNTFDGSFVITLKANNRVFGLSAIEKYHTDELDEKLENHAVREGKSVDLETALRYAEKQEKNLENE